MTPLFKHANYSIQIDVGSESRENCDHAPLVENLILKNYNTHIDLFWSNNDAR